VPKAAEPTHASRFFNARQNPEQLLGNQRRIAMIVVVSTGNPTRLSAFTLDRD
jgi:hypothetical protein